MYTRRVCFLLLLLCLGSSPAGASQRPAQLAAPQLKWQRGGCYSSWCETGWYASPTVADLDGDGNAEVIAAAYSSVILDAATGVLKKRFDPPGERQWSAPVVADLEGDGDLEIVSAHSGGYLNVYDHSGTQVWSQQLTPDDELRSLAASDLDGNGDLELLVASTRKENQWFVYEHSGQLRPGAWPQHSPDSSTNGYTAGCYNQNLATGDLDGDGRGEIVAPNDTHYVAAFQDDGAQLRANLLYGTNPDGTAKVWSRVGFHVDHAVDLRGYAHCGSEHRPNFAHSSPLLADLDDNGRLEIVVVGNVYNCGTSPYTDLYEMPYVLNADRTRWAASGFDWGTLPAPDANAAPLSEDWTVVEMNMPNPVAADLDGDGLLEILFPSYDGRLHAYWLDKTEHGAWPYTVTQAGEGIIRFASEPTVADLDNNGQAEVIFTSWAQIGSGQNGWLHVLDWQGNPLYPAVTLPAGTSSANWNGALPAPTLANIDADADLEVLLNTAHAGVVAYDLPGTANARLLWFTGRGSYLRRGLLERSSLADSQMQVNYGQANAGDDLVYTLTLRNPGPSLPNASLSGTLPAGVSYTSGLTASSGTAAFNGATLTWNGAVHPGQPVILRLRVTLSSSLVEPGTLAYTVQVNDGLEQHWQLQAFTLLNGYRLFLPLARR